MTKEPAYPHGATDMVARAEAKSGTSTAQTPARLSPGESTQLLHALRVHQIELEMQNEELRRTQAELEKARARYFDLYNLAPVGYVTLDEQGLIVEVNIMAATLLGMARSALVTQPLTRFILPEDQEVYHQLRQHLVETGAQQAAELRLWRAEAIPLWLHLEMTTAQDAGGAPICCVVMNDITERKVIEEAQLFLLQCGQVRTKEDFFESLARYLGKSLGMDYVCIDRLLGDALNAQTLAIYFDGKFQDNTAYTLRDTPCGDVVGKAVCCFPREVCRLFPRDTVLQEMRAESYIGATLWSCTGRPIGLIAVIGRRPLVNASLAEAVLKLAAVRAAGELERQQTEAALRESEENFRSLAENSHDYIMRYDRQGRHTYINSAGLKALGMAVSETLGKAQREGDLPEAQSQRWKERILHVFETAEPDQAEVEWHTADGAVVLDWRLMPEFDAEGGVHSVLGVSRDVTARKRAEAALVQEQITCAQLVQTEKLAGMGRLIASVAHELNNPLQTVANCLFLTAGDLLPDAPAHEYLQMASAEVNRLVYLVAQLRELYRPRSKGNMQPVNLSRLVEEVQALFTTQLAGRHVGWQYTPATMPAVVNGVGDQLKQVFINLTQNALDAMQAAGGTLAVQIRLSDDERQVGVVFRDTGPGIPPENLSRLFEPFFTTKFTGLGLGLAICHDIVQSHGGQLAVASQLGQGAKFTVWLPLRGPER